jgi:flagellin
MSLFIQTNVASMVAQNNFSNTQAQLASSFQKLSSGYRINSAADDAAGLGIASSMKAQVQSYTYAMQNANDGISMAQTADGAAAQIGDLLTKMRGLAVQGSNGSLSTSDSTNLNSQFQSSLAQIDNIANVTQFNGKNLLAGASASVSFQVGIGTTASDQISAQFGGADTTNLNVGTLKVDNATDSQAAITSIDTAIASLSTVREGFGAAINRLQGTISNLQSSQTNMSASLSRIQDVDIASETAALSREQVLAQAGAAVLSQANQSPQLALKLLQ